MLVGVDGCHGGWLAIIERSGESLVATTFSTFKAMMKEISHAATIGVDIPIGLPDSGKRQCDQEARKRLGWPRMSSVFPAPLRACLEARSYEDACSISRMIEGTAMSLQAYGFLPKVREVDEYLAETPWAHSLIVEVHPETSFAAWNGGIVMKHSKHTLAGRAEREALINHVWPNQIAGLRSALQGHDYQIDDLYDAFATLWSVRRMTDGVAEELGDPRARDRKKLVMKIVV